MRTTLLRRRLGVASIFLAVGVPAAIVATGTTAPTDGEGGKIVVEIVGVDVREGEVVLALFADAESFDDGGEPLRSGRLEPGEEIVWEVAEIDFGWYAVKAYHDVDVDGELDRGAFGRPTEPYGFSNDARGKFGPPPFEAARFEHRSATTEIEIELR